LMNKVGLSGDGDEGKPGRLTVADPFPAGDPVLDAALGIVAAHQGKKPDTAIKPLSKKLRQGLYERLAASGVVRADQGRIFGVLPAHRWPAQDSRHETKVRELLTQTLARQAIPDARSAALIGLLHALRCEHKIVDPAGCGLSKRQLKARAEEIAKGDWVSGAVRKVIDETTAAVAAIAAAAAVSTGAG
jgi:hypothetical protein